MKSLSLTQPHIIVMVGLPGSGKSFFAESFAKTFHAPFVSLEKIIPYTSDDDSASALMQHYVDELLKTQRTFIIEGGTDTRIEREKLTRKAKAAGYATMIVWVQTDPATAKSRSIRETKNKVNRTLSPNDYERIVKRFTPPNSLEKPTVISGKHTYTTQARIVLKKLSTVHADHPTTSTPTNVPTAVPARTDERSRRSNIIVR